MSLDNKSKLDIEEAFLLDQKLQLTVEDDFSFFCKFNELAEPVDQPSATEQVSGLSNEAETKKESSSLLVDNFLVEDDFSYFCMYDDLMGYENIPDDDETEEVSEEDSSVGMNNDKKLPLNEIAQGLEILFGALSKMKDTEDMRRYFRGEITSNELVKNADEEKILYIHKLINRVLNYKCGDTKYYIQLPVDIFFNTQETMASSYILACKLDESYNNPHMLNLVGPSDYEYNTRYIEDYLEIAGDFSQIPNGVKLATCDYLQILKRYPNIIEHIIHLMKTDYQFSHHYVGKSDEEMHQLALEHLQRWFGWYPKLDNQGETLVLSKETIDSITFVESVEYITLDDVISGNFGSFEELLKQYDNVVLKKKF